MVDIFMFPAYEGDCILIRYGEPNGIKHNILVDGGVDVNARDIAEIIEFVYSNEERIDIVITHIDGDHIQGLISGLNMVSSEKLQACLSTIYFNNHRDIVKSLKLSGMSDKGAEDSIKTVVYSSNGYSVSEAKSLLEILRDKGVGDKIDGFVTMGRNIEIAGAILNIISPSEKELKKLAIEWESELKKEDKIITGYATENPEQIDIDELMQKNSKWDIDHIYPQSKIKDDSIDNMVLAKKVINNSKQNKLLSPDIRIKMKKYWNTLYKGNFISKKKYDRLTRTEDFTNEELSGFIERQIVETRQSSKAVAELLNRLYEHSEIVYVKAGLVSDFRHDNKLLKSRRINDYHHAKDAFLNIVVGNVYNAKFTSNPRKWIKENRGTNYSIRRVFDYNVKRGNTVVWQGVKDAGHSIEAIRKTMARNDILYTEYTYCDKGELFNATLVRKGNDKAINLKKDLDSVKYGGYNTPKTSAFAFIEFDGKKKERKNHIVEIPVYIVNIASRQPDTIKEYLEQKKGYKNVVVKKYPIKKNALIKVDGYLARLRGATEKDVLLKNAVQLVLRDEYSENIRKVEKYLENNIQYQADSKFEGFTQEDLNDLYDELYIKLKESIYNKRPANQLGTLEKGREKYRAIGDLREKAKIINNILALFQCDATTSTNLKEIGGTANAGNMAYNKNTLPTKKLILIHQSVTGLFETEEELV